MPVDIGDAFEKIIFSSLIFKGNLTHQIIIHPLSGLRHLHIIIN